MTRAPISPRNFHTWRAISYFLAGFEVMATARVQVEKAPQATCAAHEKRSAGAAQGAGGVL